MTESRHPSIEASIHETFTRGVGDRDAAEVQDHLRECESCRRLYDRYVEAERMLFAEAREASPAAFERVEHRLFPEPARPRRLRGWSAALVMGAAAAGLILVVGSGTALLGDPASDALLARGAGPADHAAVSVRLLRMRPEGDEIAITDLATAVPSIQAGDRVVLLYTNHAAARSVRVELRTSDGEPLLTFERDLEQGVEDARLWGPSEAGPWPLGALELEAVFEGPNGERWERALRLERRGSP